MEDIACCCMCDEELDPMTCYSRLTSHDKFVRKHLSNSIPHSYDSTVKKPLFFLRDLFYIFPKVYAKSQSVEEIAAQERKDFALKLEPFARKYIASEDGMERVKSIFKKDVNNEMSAEFKGLFTQLCTIGGISFILKYIPTFFEAKEQFWKDYRATVFRTSNQANRLCQDTIMSKAMVAGLRAAVPMTLFGGGILVISQLIQSYNNKTTPYEYGAAVAIVGAFSRLHYGGIRGFIFGSVLGAVVGLVFGAGISPLLHYNEATTEERHVYHVCERLAVEHSIVGEKEFKNRMRRLMEGEKMKIISEETTN